MARSTYDSEGRIQVAKVQGFEKRSVIGAETVRNSLHGEARANVERIKGSEARATTQRQLDARRQLIEATEQSRARSEQRHSQMRASERAQAQQVRIQDEARREDTADQRRAKSAAQRFAERRQRVSDQIAKDEERQRAAKSKAALGAGTALAKGGEGGGRLGKAATSLGERITQLPTPGGALSVFVVLLVFLFAIVPVNAGYTRIQLLWYTLLGRTTLDLAPEINIVDPVHPVHGAPHTPSAPSREIQAPTGRVVSLAEADALTSLPTLPFGLPM